MFNLPAFSIERDEYAEVRLAAQAREWIERGDATRGTGIHASDLMDPLLAYWKRMDPQPLSERTVWLFVIGKILHHFVIDIAGPGKDAGQTDSGTREALGILFSPDDVQGGSPIELKTTRASKEPDPRYFQTDYHHYLEQLTIYMVCMGVLHGWLWILHINMKDASNRTWPEPRCYKVSITDSEFYEYETQILDTKMALETAIETRNPAGLPLCRAWLCGDTCGYWHACQPLGRYPNTNKRQWSTG